MESKLGDDQIEYMVRRFLGWRLPENFNPDGGISFRRTFNENTAHPMKSEPVGTNLFDYEQTKQMIKYLIEGMPSSAEKPPDLSVRGTDEELAMRCALAAQHQLDMLNWRNWRKSCVSDAQVDGVVPIPSPVNAGPVENTTSKQPKAEPSSPPAQPATPNMDWVASKNSHPNPHPLNAGLTSAAAQPAGGARVQRQEFPTDVTSPSSFPTQQFDMGSRSDSSLQGSKSSVARDGDKLPSIFEQNDALLESQRNRIVSLEREVAQLQQERDALKKENDRLSGRRVYVSAIQRRT